MENKLKIKDENGNAITITQDPHNKKYYHLSVKEWIENEHNEDAIEQMSCAVATITENDLLKIKEYISDLLVSNGVWGNQMH